MKDLRIAAVCMESDPWDYEGNLDRMETLVNEASANNADIVCFPECAVTGYILKDPGRIYPHAVSGEIIQRICTIAQKANLLVLTGMIEIHKDGRPFISHIAAGPRGLISIYRKSHLSPAETNVYHRGDAIDPFDHKDIRFGIQLCYESHFPEISTILALKGAEIIFIPHASPRGTPEEKLESWLRHLTGRAFDNSLFIVACNQVGHDKAGLDFPGTALVIGPSGRLLASYASMEQGILFADIRGQEIEEIKGHKMRYFLPNRRPEMYKEISE